jgi:hypothetical protein
MLQKEYNSQPSAITSYNYTDIADATGIRLFYGVSVEGTPSTILTQNQIYGGGETYGDNTTVTPTKVIDVDFDLSAFNANQLIRGTALFNFCRALHSQVGSTFTGYAYFIIKIRKWDGLAETDLATSGHVGYTEVYGVTDIKTITSVALSIPTTPFKKGDVLRVTIEGWAYVSLDNSSNKVRLVFAYNPMNLDGTYIKPSTDNPTTITQLKCWIPFNLDL